MKYLTDRQQIAVAMNFGKYPVLHIDRETPKEGYKDYFVGDQVKVLTPRVGYPDMYCTGKLYWEYGRYGVLTDGTVLSGSFGYSGRHGNAEECPGSGYQSWAEGNRC